MRHIIIILSLMLSLVSYAQESQYQKAKSAFDRGDYESALSLLTELADMPYADNPEYTEGKIYTMIATTHYKLGDLEIFQKKMDEGIMKYPTDSTMVNLYFLQALEGKKLDQFVVFIDSSLIKYPEQRGLFLFIKARMYLMDSQFEAAEPIYDELLKLEPDNAFANMDMGYYSMEYANKFAKDFGGIDKVEGKDKLKLVKYYYKAMKYLELGGKLAQDSHEMKAMTHFYNEALASRNLIHFSHQELVDWEDELNSY